jgi:hypothetical protein
MISGSEDFMFVQSQLIAAFLPLIWIWLGTFVALALIIIIIVSLDRPLEKLTARLKSL